MNVGLVVIGVNKLCMVYWQVAVCKRLWRAVACQVRKTELEGDRLSPGIVCVQPLAGYIIKSLI